MGVGSSDGPASQPANHMLLFLQLFAPGRFHLNGHAVAHDDTHLPVFQLAQFRDNPLFCLCQPKFILLLYIAAPFTVRYKTKSRAPRFGRTDKGV